ncbi:probable rRNA-processing protein EBP2 isoform X2 [Stegodyphus dumicola]|uniref:probable rRNA-processing protein EBP2 isoform X2 n=1 Tax=Stegodyphus dumicola TaxID=202533 RepID=UPI0015AB6581|nr:probable rRNA-processing protein EBP2 isoform X2 [Stegodyphus dumicola]
MSDLSDASVEDAVVEDVLNAQKRKLIPVNNVTGLLSKLKEIQLNLDWVEKLDTTVNVSALPSEQSKESAAVDTVAENDFKREMSFCNQAMSATSKALKRLEKLGIPTKRPTDFLAEMAKSDAHMKKVREKLLSKQLIVERSEKVRAIREQKKQGKKIQQEVLQQKREEKKKMLNALKKTKKAKGIGSLETASTDMEGRKKELNGIQQIVVPCILVNRKKDQKINFPKIRSRSGLNLVQRSIEGVDKIKLLMSTFMCSFYFLYLYI